MHRDVTLAFRFCIGRLDGLALGMACITCAQDLPCLNSLVGRAFVYFDFRVLVSSPPLSPAHLGIPLLPLASPSRLPLPLGPPRYRPLAVPRVPARRLAAHGRIISGGGPHHRPVKGGRGIGGRQTAWLFNDVLPLGQQLPASLLFPKGFPCLGSKRRSSFRAPVHGYPRRAQIISPPPHGLRATTPRGNSPTRCLPAPCPVRTAPRLLGSHARHCTRTIEMGGQERLAEMDGR